MLDWQVEDGRWWVVLMNAAGSPGVEASLDVGAELDDLLWIGVGLLVAGGVLALVAAAFVSRGVPRNAR